MEHTAIIVGNMDETIHYYGDMFGFKFAFKDLTRKERWLFCILKNSRVWKLSSFEILIRLESITKAGLLTTLPLR
ncbi:VOC family protein [Priestia megaterium]|uniref:VOC family protein n=1 Tax=Priestia megaterium TaxID=1404 RepID=UPI00332AC6EE